MDDDLLTGLPTDLPSFLGPLRQRRAVSRLSGPGALARGLPLRRLRPRARLQPQAAVDRGMRGLRQAAFAARGHDLRADQDRLVALVPGDLPGDLEQGRDLGHGAQAPDGLWQSTSTAWSWLHKIRKAMVAAGADAAGAAGRGRRDPMSAAPRPGKPGRGAAGKTKVAGAVESGRGQTRGRRLGRLRLAGGARCLGQQPRRASWPRPWPGRRRSRPTAGQAMAASRPPATPTSRSPGRQLGRCGAAPAGDPPGVRPRQALAARHPPRRGLAPSTCRPISTSSCSACMGLWVSRAKFAALLVGSIFVVTTTRQPLGK